MAMRELFGDIWTVNADVRVIPTNGDINKRGFAVMGRGIVLQATYRFPDVALALAEHLRRNGNHVGLISWTPLGSLIACPVKHHWNEMADIELIKRSVGELVIFAEMHPDWQVYATPRLGCGNGRLDWEQDVEPVIRPILDDRFVVVYDGS